MRHKWYRIIALTMAIALILSAWPAIVHNTVQAAGTTYYVDNLTGNDGNLGTSTGSAWKTLTKVNSITFSPGDRILFKVGGSWNGQLRPKGSGSNAEPIIIDKYGTGSKPIINGGGITGATVYFYNVQYWEMNNLEITNTNGGPDAGAKFGIQAVADDIGTLKHIYIKNCYVHDVNSVAGSKDYAGIDIRKIGATTPSRFDDVLIEGNTIENVSALGLRTSGQWSDRGGMTGTGTWTPHLNVVIRNNTFIKTGRNAMMIMHAKDPLIEYNVIQQSSQKEHGNSLMTFNTDGALVQFNEAYGNPNTSTDGAGFDIDWNTNDNIFQYNYSHDNKFGAFQTFASGTDGFNRDNVFRYNIAESNNGMLVRHAGRIENMQIYNNTIYENGGSKPFIQNITFEGSVYANQIKYDNNIVYYVGSNNGYSFGGSTNNSFAHNVFYGISTPSGSNVTNSNTLTSDPKLVAPGTGGTGINTVDGYKLRTDSPLINSGNFGKLISTNGGKDYWGNAVSSSSASKRGAYNGAGVAGADLSGTYTIRNKQSDKKLHNSSEAYSGGDDTGKYAIVHPSVSGSDYQQWNIQPDGNGYYTIKSMQTGKYLHNSAETYSGGSGKYVISYTENSGADYQLWQIVSAGGGYYRIVSKQTNQYLHESAEVYSGSSIGQYVITYSHLNMDAQLWKFE